MFCLAGMGQQVTTDYGSETIFALASGSGRAGVAVIRISGPCAEKIIEKMIIKKNVQPRQVVLANILCPETGDVLDTGIVLWFPQPHSFTGENICELHVHGGRATVDRICDVLAKIEGFRFAEPGEFTRRAFENGKLDLTEVEGLADLVAAETLAQQKQALTQLRGGLRQIYENWRGDLLRALARLEAVIDFPDEDLPDGLDNETKHNILGLVEKISQYLDDSDVGEIIRDGLAIAIVGAPNVGKSSVLNCLARRDAAIVSEIAGTTRDVIEVRMDVGGFPVTLADTAGLREGGGEIESIGIERARAWAGEADLRLVVLDASVDEMDAASSEYLGPGSIIIANKVDLVPGHVLPDSLADRGALSVSARTGAGIDGLMARLSDIVSGLLARRGPPPLTRPRHRAALNDCVAALERALEPGLAAELVAEDVRLAARCLGRITGIIDVEDVLDVIFGEFCIGK
jgi:tRNA modification GTPase